MTRGRRVQIPVTVSHSIQMMKHDQEAYTPVKHKPQKEEVHMPHFRDVKRTLTQQRTEYPIKMQHAYPSVNIGWGAHTMVGNDAKALGMTNALIVTTGLRGTGIVEAVQGVLKHAGVSSELYAKATPNPKDHEVMEGAKILATGKFD